MSVLKFSNIRELVSEFKKVLNTPIKSKGQILDEIALEEPSITVAEAERYIEEDRVRKYSDLEVTGLDTEKSSFTDTIPTSAYTCYLGWSTPATEVEDKEVRCRYCGRLREDKYSPCKGCGACE